MNASDAVDVSPSADKAASQDKKKKKDKPKNDITCKLKFTNSLILSLMHAFTFTSLHMPYPFRVNFTHLTMLLHSYKRSCILYYLRHIIFTFCNSPPPCISVIPVLCFMFMFKKKKITLVEFKINLIFFGVCFV